MQKTQTSKTHKIIQKTQKQTHTKNSNFKKYTKHSNLKIKHQTRQT